MPFFHDGVFHLYYLLDENHHQGLGGLGGHQWAHASTADLRHWEHHPAGAAHRRGMGRLDLHRIDVFYHDGVYHAFYATRRPDCTQHLSHAVSPDGDPLRKDDAEPAGLACRRGYRAFISATRSSTGTRTGRFHMLVTAQIENFPLHDRGGCLLRLSSPNLANWKVEGPLLVPGGERGYASIPECADLFEWNGWFYLLFGLKLHTHYRVARSLAGPWLRPAVDTLDNSMLAVMKTAPFGEERRIGAGWVPTREGNLDGGRWQWGGRAVLRELVQHRDGTLGTAFPGALRGGGSAVPDLRLLPLTPGASGTPERVALRAAVGPRAVAAIEGVPHDASLRLRVRPGARAVRYGLGLRGAGNEQSSCELTFQAPERCVRLADEGLTCVEGLDRPFDLEVVLHGDVLDVCHRGRALPDQLPARDARSLPAVPVRRGWRRDVHGYRDNREAAMFRAASMLKGLLCPGIVAVSLAAAGQVNPLPAARLGRRPGQGLARPLGEEHHRRRPQPLLRRGDGRGDRLARQPVPQRLLLRLPGHRRREVGRPARRLGRRLSSSAA